MNDSELSVLPAPRGGEGKAESGVESKRVKEATGREEGKGGAGFGQRETRA